VVILGLAGFVELRLVTDGRTDTPHDDSIYRAVVKTENGEGGINKLTVCNTTGISAWTWNSLAS